MKKYHFEREKQEKLAILMGLLRHAKKLDEEFFQHFLMRIPDELSAHWGYTRNGSLDDEEILTNEILLQRTDQELTKIGQEYSNLCTKSSEQ